MIRNALSPIFIDNSFFQHAIQRRRKFQTEQGNQANSYLLLSSAREEKNKGKGVDDVTDPNSLLSAPPAGSNSSSAPSTPQPQIQRKRRLTFQQMASIPRDELDERLRILRLSAMGTSQQRQLVAETLDHTHVSVPIADMGNYHEALAKREVLRSVEGESDPGLAKPYFGNPFRNSDRSAPRMAVDEADEFALNGSLGKEKCDI